MTEPTIVIPGRSELLVLDSCEVEWLSARGLDAEPEFESAADPLPPGTAWSFIGDRIEGDANIDYDMRLVAAAYECALRDAVLDHLEPEGGKVEVHLWTGRSAVYIYNSLGFGIERNEHEGPTPLHALRAAAQHLKVGPWASPGKEMP